MFKRTTEMQQLSQDSQISQQTSAGSTQQHPQVLQPNLRVLQQPREPFPSVEELGNDIDFDSDAVRLGNDVDILRTCSSFKCSFMSKRSELNISELFPLFKRCYCKKLLLMGELFVRQH